jgi:two-component system response regulator RegA
VARHKVLFVDDDETILSGYHAGFCRTHHVFTATNAQTAVAIVDSQRPDIVVLDLRIGNDWGITLLRRVRLRLPDAKIVLVSGFVSVATAVSAVRAGADHVLPKPTSAGQLLRELAAAPEPPAHDEPDDHLASLERVEWEHIVRVLDLCNGNISETARRLGIGRPSLQRKLKRLPPPPR